MWYARLSVDPLPALRSSADPALRYWLRRCLTGEPVAPVEDLWRLPVPAKILARQRPDGAWSYAGRVPSYFNHDLLETFRALGVLVGQHGFTRAHPAIAAAAAYVFSCQTPEGDLRGILGTQHMPYYHGAILALLIRAGFADDPRVLAGLDWLLAVRQDDGGWIVPIQAVPPRAKTAALWTGAPLPPDRSLPHAHLATGMALRPLALHPLYRANPAVRLAATRLAGRFFQADRYGDRRSPAYWTKLQYPFWWTDLVAALTSLAHLGFSAADPALHRALTWFVDHQQADGLWPTGYDKGQRATQMRLWVGLAICLVLRHFPESV